MSISTLPVSLSSTILPSMNFPVRVPELFLIELIRNYLILYNLIWLVIELLTKDIKLITILKEVAKQSKFGTDIWLLINLSV